MPRPFLTLAILVAILAGPVVWIVAVEPRAIGLTRTDSMHDYYANAQLIYRGEAPIGDWHPGTPIYYLAAAIMSAAGTDVSAASDYAMIGIFVVALSTVACSYAFLRILIPSVGAAGAWIALFAAWTWPTFLTYLDNFSSDSFILPLSLLLSALLWRRWERGDLVSLVVFGAMLGFALSVKLSLAPFAACAGASLIVQRIAAPISKRRLSAEVLLFAASTCAAFAIAVWPIIERGSCIAESLFSRGLTQRGEGFAISLLRGGYLFLVKAGWPAAILFCAGLFAWKSSSPRSFRGNRGLDFAAWSFCGCGVLCLAKLLADCKVQSYSNFFGVTLRNTSGTAALFPILALLIARTRLPVTTAAALRALCPAALTLTVALVYGLYCRHRDLQLLARQEAVVQQALIDESARSGRTAFFDGSNGWMFGDASFHFWSNAAYGRSRRDDDLLSAFPNLAYLNVRRIRVAERETESPPDVAAANRRQSHLCGLRQNVADAPFLVGPPSEVRTVAVIVTPADEDTDAPDERWVQRLRTYAGLDVLNVERRPIDDKTLLLMQVRPVDAP